MARFVTPSDNSDIPALPTSHGAALFLKHPDRRGHFKFKRGIWDQIIMTFDTANETGGASLAPFEARLKVRALTREGWYESRSYDEE